MTTDPLAPPPPPRARSQTGALLARPGRWITAPVPRLWLIIAVWVAVDAGHDIGSHPEPIDAPDGLVVAIVTGAILAGGWVIARVTDLIGAVIGDATSYWRNR